MFMVGLQFLCLFGVERVINFLVGVLCVVVGRRGIGFWNLFVGIGELGLRLKGGWSLEKWRCGVVWNVLVVDIDVLIRENFLVWEKFCIVVGNINQMLQKVVKLNYWVVCDYDKFVNVVNSLESYMRSLLDVQLCEKIIEFQECFKKGEFVVLNIVSL